MAKVIANMDSLLKKLDRLGGDTKNAIVRAMKTTLQSAEGDAKANSMYGSVRTSIKSEHKVEPDKIEGKVFTNLPHAVFIEFGTGPVGAANHSGISPEVPVTYTQHPWVYHSEDYGFVTTSGQPARPFLYPAAKENESVFEGETRKELLSAIRRAGG
jgi:HK97 gp10 family phage protein